MRPLATSTVATFSYKAAMLYVNKMRPTVTDVR